MREYGANVAHLLIAQMMDLLKLFEQDLVLLAQGRLRRCTDCYDEERAKQQCPGQGRYLFSVR